MDGVFGRCMKNIIDCLKHVEITYQDLVRRAGVLPYIRKGIYYQRAYEPVLTSVTFLCHSVLAPPSPNRFSNPAHQRAIRYTYVPIDDRSQQSLPLTPTNQGRYGIFSSQRVPIMAIFKRKSTSRAAEDESAPTQKEKVKFSKRPASKSLMMPWCENI